MKFLLADFGAISIIKILVKNTPLDIKPFNCSLCMGFWVGVILFLVSYAPYCDIVFYPLAGAGACWILYRLTTGDF